MDEPLEPQAIVGVDVGGTFTDFVLLEESRMHIWKCSTTPADQTQAIASGLAELGIRRTVIVHGTTLATNALLERRGARTALLTTASFADVLVIGRQNRPYLYRLGQEREPPLVPDGWRREVAERLDATGKVLVPLDEEAVDEVVGRLVSEGVESLAIVFLFSFRNPAHERRAAERIRARYPHLTLSLSSEVLPEYREYERTVTTVVNAYVSPLVGRYMERLAQVLAGGHIRVMQSNGGVTGPRQAAAQAARLVLSGPAGGVVGAFFIARESQPDSSFPPHIITLDMGGTSTDVALCPGTIPYTPENTVAGLPLRLPAVDVHTVGAGGGSITWVDAAGVLHVGPQSAGAVPGPVCYRRGGRIPTVTDAHLVLGRLHPAYFLGGRGDISLDLPAARSALARLGQALGGLTPEEAALGVIRVTNATMERALRYVSVERGYDPRRFTLLPFGGAGPLHACALAEALSIPLILVPPHPGVLSALGLLVADVTCDASRSVLGDAGEWLAEHGPLAAVLEELAEQVRATLRAEGFPSPNLEAALDLRYRGQSYELTVPLSLPPEARALEAFHAAHRQRYGYAMPTEAVEVVTVRVRGIGPVPRPALPRAPRETEDATPALLGLQPVWFRPDGPTATLAYDRSGLRPGNRFRGPAIVFQYDTTVLVHPGWEAEVDEWGNIRMARTDSGPW